MCSSGQETNILKTLFTPTLILPTQSWVFLIYLLSKDLVTPPLKTGISRMKWSNLIAMAVIRRSASKGHVNLLQCYQSNSTLVSFDTNSKFTCGWRAKQLVWLADKLLRIMQLATIANLGGLIPVFTFGSRKRFKIWDNLWKVVVYLESLRKLELLVLIQFFCRSYFPKLNNRGGECKVNHTIVSLLHVITTNQDY